MNPFLGEVRTFPWGFAPKGWAQCNGQLMPINQNQALFALLGTFYGGNGQTTFALPDLRGRTALGIGTGGGQTYNVGQFAGVETIALSVANLPAHSHNVNAVTTAGNNSNALNGLPATVGQIGTFPTIFIYTPVGGGTVALANDTFSSVGGGAAHNNMQPFLTLNLCIALQGIFPSRN